MSASKWLIAIVLLGVIESLSAAPAEHKINASKIGSGGVGRAIDWNAEAAQSPVWCDTACNYQRVSTAKVAPQSVLTYGPTTWPNNGVTTFPNPAPIVQVGDPTPQNATTSDTPPRPIVYEVANYERAAVDVFRDGQSITAKVYQSGNQVLTRAAPLGSASAALAYHVKVQNLIGEGRDYFIRFNAPRFLGGNSPAYNLATFSGAQKQYIAPDYVKYRSTVDILVNGLPIWTTADHFFYPADYSGGPFGGFETDWGYESAYDQYTIFIGRFAANTSFNLDFIVRADSAARAPQCGKENEPSTYTNPHVFMRCNLVGAGRDLPGTPSGVPGRFEIYSKTVSTQIIQTLPGGPIPPLNSSTP